MRDINRYILEKLHLNKESKYKPFIKDEDALYLRFRCGTDVIMIVGYYANIKECKNGIIDSTISAGTRGKNSKLHNEGFKLNSHGIYESINNSESTNSESIIYLNAKDAIKFLTEIIDKDYKLTNKDLEKYLDNKDFLTSKEIFISDNLKEKVEEYLDNFKTFEDE